MDAGPVRVAQGLCNLVQRGAGLAQFDGRVLARSYLGERLEFLVHSALGPIKGCAALDAPFREGQAVALRLDPARAAFIG